MDFIAHRSENADTQSVGQHLTEVSKLSREFAAKIDLALSGEMIGLLHDLGKYSFEFQQYIRMAVDSISQDQDTVGPTARNLKGRIDHSTSGAQTLWRELSSRGVVARALGQTLAVCVASHHSGLINCLTPEGSDQFAKRMQKDEALAHCGEAWLLADPVVRERCEDLARDREFIESFQRKLNSLGDRANNATTLWFGVGLLVKFLFSCLLDADRISTADFESPASARQRSRGKYPQWHLLIDRLERHFAQLPILGRVDALRCEVSQQCLAAAARNQASFSLTVPTGGGKTLSSLRFALHHAAKHALDRVFYVVPYTTIIDQNAQQVRAILEPTEEGVTPGSVVLEHHSNLTPERQTWRNKVLSENWDAPVVFTTSVQFLESLFGRGTRGPRRMHQLANSVVIFDEVQQLPVKCVHLFNNAINFLVEQCRCTVLLCTATQPLLDQVDPDKGALRLGTNAEILSDVGRLFRDLKRVQVQREEKPGGWTYEDIADLALSELHRSGSCLVVVNTKSAAKRLFEICNLDSNGSVYHLSSSMCPAHRRSVLADIKEKLRCGEPVLCVSTQLIEAGVDIDFGCVVRFSAGLDSIAQSAGRCNRHGLRPTGCVYVINPREDGADMLTEIREGKAAADRVFRELSDADDVLQPVIMQRYFEYYFFARRKIMGYPVSAREVGHDDTLLEMLAQNTMAVAAHGRTPENPLSHSFMTASEAFNSIDAPTRGVIVPHQRGETLIAELAGACDMAKRFRLLHEAQQYAVNVFPQVLDRLHKEGAVKEVPEGSGMLCLNERYYHPQFGLSEKPVAALEVLDV